MAQDAKPTQAPLLCATGCGFYGNPRTNGMCSVCYRDSLQRHNGSSRVSEPVSTNLGIVEVSPSTESPPVSPDPAQEEDSLGPVTAAAVPQAEPVSGTSQTEPKTEDVAGAFRSASVDSRKGCTITEQSGSGGSEDDATRRGRRGCEEVLQLDGVSDEGTVSRASELDISVEPSTVELENSKPKRNRCFTCRKKVGLTGFDCRCGNLFCGVHRYSDVHNCTYDYKADAAQKIRKENPVIVGEKIQKI